MTELLAAFIFFFAVIDPIGTVPVFIAVTRWDDAKFKRKVALRAVGVSPLVLLFFVLRANYFKHDQYSAFSVSDCWRYRIINFCLSMIFGESKPERNQKRSRQYRNGYFSIWPFLLLPVQPYLVLMTSTEYTWYEQL